MEENDTPPEEAIPVGYSKDYSERDFWQKVKDYALQAGAGVIELALQLYYAAADPATPRWARLTIIGALGYFIAPIDAVPDMIPGIGYVDDLGVLSAAVAMVAMSIKDEHRAKAREKMQLFFGRDDKREG